MRSGRPSGLRSWAMWSLVGTLDLFYVEREDMGKLRAVEDTIEFMLSKGWFWLLSGVYTGRGMSKMRETI